MNLDGQGRPLSVLIVEDDFDNAESWALLLRLWGHQVQIARDGRAALQTAQTALPEVVLLDLALPKMDGYAVAKRLCQALPKKPLFVALSGYCRESDQQRSLAEGFDHFLAKPADPSHVKRLLEAFAAGAAAKQ
jgi:CheY-like chemotaxis protein